MKYITHRRYKGKDVLRNQLNLPYGTELEEAEGFIATKDGHLICYPTSKTAEMHFAPNDDGRGLERGALTWAIAYSHRERKWPDKSVHRFSESEAEMLTRSWSHWLRQDVDAILFNGDFFAARPEDLQRLADALKIIVRR